MAKGYKRARLVERALSMCSGSVRSGLERLLRRHASIDGAVASGFIGAAKRMKAVDKAYAYVSMACDSLIFGDVNSSDEDEDFVAMAAKMAEAVGREWSQQADVERRERFAFSYLGKSAAGFAPLFFVGMGKEGFREWVVLAGRVSDRDSLFAGCLSSLGLVEREVGRFFGVPDWGRDTPIVKKMRTYANESWWRRNIRKEAARRLEQFMREMGLVSKMKGIYCSESNVRRYVKRQEKNREAMAKMFLTNQHGQTMSMLELFEGSVANPDVRRMELMTRLRGGEEVAREQGLKAMFYTVTAPSKYHPVRGSTGVKNQKYNGATARETHAYLQGNWRKVRAMMSKNGINVVGCRVVEPHHDGTPHWHMLIWVREEDEAYVTETMREYALDEDGDERGAMEHRFTAEYIDPAKGSAVGYIAKYISKNVNGKQFVEYDEYGKPLDESAPRVAAWASVHGIRQFQFFGFPSVTVWRELRRVREENKREMEGWAKTFGYTDRVANKFGGLVDAAENGDWAEYVRLMGGFCVPADQRSVKMWKEVRVIDSVTGKRRKEEEGDAGASERVVGVEVLGSPFMTRWYVWQDGMGEGVEVESEAEGEAPWTRVNNCNATICRKGVSEFIDKQTYEDMYSILCEKDNQFMYLQQWKKLSIIREEVMVQRLREVDAEEERARRNHVMTNEEYLDWEKRQMEWMETRSYKIGATLIARRLSKTIGGAAFEELGVDYSEGFRGSVLNVKALEEMNAKILGHA